MQKKLSSINLNLINVLNELLIERNTTNAARKLNLSQPAISYSLKQLREIFEDELLIKNNFSNRMSLTPIAKSLIKPVSNTVQDIEHIFRSNTFVPGETRRQIKIASTDYGLAFILPKLIKKAKAAAPYMSFFISDINYSNTKEQLENEDIDIGIGVFQLEKNISTLRYEYLLTDEIVCVADKNHPVSRKRTLSLEDYLSYPHISARFPKSGWMLTAEELIDLPAMESISVHNSTETVSLLQDTEFLILSSRRLAEKYSSFYNFSVLAPEFPTPEITVSLCRHINRDNDKAVLWIESLIKEIAAGMCGGEK